MKKAKILRTHGRSKKPKSPKSARPALPYYETLGQAATAMDVSEAVLSAARKANAPGFRGPRVYPTELLPWLKEHQSELEGDGDQKRQLECRKLRAQCERIEFDNKAAAGEYVLVAEADAWLVSKAESLKRLLRTKLENELLPKLPGLMVPEMVPHVRAICASIIADFRKPLPRKAAPDPEPE